MVTQITIDLAIPFGIILGGVILTLITGKLQKSDISRGIGIASLLTAIILLAVNNPFKDVLYFQNLLNLDQFGGFFVFLFLGLGILVLLGTMKMLDDIPEMVALVLLSTLGMSVVSIANDLLMLFVAWETMSLATYVLTGVGRKKKSTEAAMKYFIYGAVSSALVLFAISLVYGLVGTTRLHELGPALGALTLADPSAIAVAALAATIFVFGFGYKMGMVPFHLWLPDVYEGAPAPISGFLAGVAKKVAIVAAVRIFLEGLRHVEQEVLGMQLWQFIFAIVAVVTMTVGNVAALAQKNVFRMFAYSSISQVGYIMIGFSVLDPGGLSAAVLQITMHSVTTVGAFVTIGIIQHKQNFTTYNDYKGLGRSSPLLATTLTIMMLSLAGIPPLGGFLSKLFLFRAAVKGGLLWLTIVGVLNSVLSLGYYLPLIRNMFLEKAEEVEEGEEVKEVVPLGKRILGPKLVSILSALAVFVLAGVAQILFNVITTAAEAVLL